MLNIVDIPDIIDNNCILFKNNYKYIQVKFIQLNKMTKSIEMFFNDLDLAYMHKYPNY